VKQAIANQKGVSIVAVIATMLILSVMGVTLISLVTTGSDVSINQLQSEQAFNVAEGGLENATLLLNTSDITNRISCANVNANLNAKPIGAGQFTVTADVGSPFYPALPTTLNGAIGIADATINVNSTVGYAPSGRIMIDRELIDYFAISGNSFIGAARGSDGTTAAAHANGASVGQYQCTATSTGGIPSVAAPTARRQVTEGIQLQEGWAVGAGGNILRWQQTGWTSYGIVVARQLNGISMLSYADGRAVGNPGGIAAQRPLVLRYINGAWVSQNTGLNINRVLNSIYCVASNDCWAVGAQGGVASNQRPWIVQYNGAWSNINTGNTANAPLNSVYCPASGNCWAVGNAVGGFELVYRLAGGVWARQANNPNIPTRNLMNVFCTGTTECFVVGAAGTSSRWTSAGGWTNISPAIAQQLNSVYMLDINNDGIADDGWAVGASNGTRPTALRWNTNCSGVGTTGVWNNCTIAPYVPLINTALNEVSCVDSSDCWAAGNVSGGETILHWDGTSWARVAPSGAIPNVNLMSVYIIGPKLRPQAVWQEVFP